ncbi:MAG TPA: hypothetical protein VK402_09670 [Blastococcus sp.]|nr:hypothetical protein [Blastococcus sp.]
MTSPDEVERQHTLRTAVARYEELRSRELLADSAEGSSPGVADGERLPAADVLELLALSEVIARKAGYGQQLAVRTARAAGASWTAIARALGMSKQAAWEAHTRWIDDQADQNRTTGHQGLDADEAARARRMAGSPGDEA